MALSISIPGDNILHIQHLVLDYNGTIAIDGKFISNLKPLFEKLSSMLEIHVLTADTFGTAKEQLVGLPCKIHVLGPANQDIGKLKYVEAFGLNRTICIGNGRNDYLMIKKAAIGIAVIIREGAAGRTLLAADIVCTDIISALELIINPKRMAATLRT